MTRQARSWADIRSTKVSPDQEEAVAAGVRALRDALALRELRTERGLTQVEVALRLGKTQATVSELERRSDAYLSSLREYVEALGGRLELTAVFPDEGQEADTSRLIDLMAALEATVDATKASQPKKAGNRQSTLANAG